MTHFNLFTKREGAWVHKHKRIATLSLDKWHDVAFRSSSDAAAVWAGSVCNGTQLNSISYPSQIKSGPQTSLKNQARGQFEGCFAVRSTYRSTRCKDHRGGQKELIQIFVAMFSGSGLRLVTYLHVCLPGWWVCWGCPCAGKNTPLWPPRSHWLSANRRQLALPRQQVVLRTVYPHVGVRVRIHVNRRRKAQKWGYFLIAEKCSVRLRLFRVVLVCVSSTVCWYGIALKQA